MSGFGTGISTLPNGTCTTFGLAVAVGLGGAVAVGRGVAVPVGRGVAVGGGGVAVALGYGVGSSPIEMPRAGRVMGRLRAWCFPLWRKVAALPVRARVGVALAAGLIVLCSARPAWWRRGGESARVAGLCGVAVALGGACSATARAVGVVVGLAVAVGAGTAVAVCVGVGSELGVGVGFAATGDAVMVATPPAGGLGGEVCGRLVGVGRGAVVGVGGAVGELVAGGGEGRGRLVAVGGAVGELVAGGGAVGELVGVAGRAVDVASGASARAVGRADVSEAVGVIVGLIALRD